MPMMKSPYDQVISSLSGHRLVFEANVPLHVPDSVVPEALAVGVKHTDEEPPAPETAPVATGDNVIAEAEAFDAALESALMRILTRNDPSDFKNDNTPKVAKVVAEMDPEHRRPTATEISEAYERLQENIDLAE